MLQAALKEIRTTPIATIGALAGIASFALVVTNPPQASAQVDLDVRSTAAALAFIKLALVVPGVAFFFAFLAHLVALTGPLRGLFATAVFLLMCEVFTAAGAGVILSEIRIGYHYDTRTVMGIPVIALAIAIVVTNLLVFATVLAPTAFAMWQDRQLSLDEEDERARDSGDVFVFGFGGLFVLFATVGLVLVVLQASLGLVG